MTIKVAHVEMFDTDIYDNPMREEFRGFDCHDVGANFVTFVWGSGHVVAIATARIKEFTISLENE